MKTYALKTLKNFDVEEWAYWLIGFGVVGLVLAFFGFPIDVVAALVGGWFVGGLIMLIAQDLVFTPALAPWTEFRNARSNQNDFPVKNEDDFPVRNDFPVESSSGPVEIVTENYVVKVVDGDVTAIPKKEL